MKFHYKELKDVKQGGFETRPYKDSLRSLRLETFLVVFFQNFPGDDHAHDL